VQSTLNYPNLWIKPISWTRISQKFRITFNQKLNYSEIVKSLWHGTPNGTESDICLIEIMYNSLNKMYQIPQICIEILTRDDDTTGYPLTHRLLIIQTIKAVNIVIENPYLTYKILAKNINECEI
jgi:selenophosphate synthase